MIKMDIGLCIKSARKKAGLTQKSLAEKSGLAEITIRQYETNKREPRNEQIRKIAHALGLTEEELLGFDRFTNDALEHLSREKEEYQKKLESTQINELEKKLYEAEITNINFWELDFQNQLSRSSEELLKLFNKLNFQGQDKAIEQVEMLSKIPEYQKNGSPK